MKRVIEKFSIPAFISAVMIFGISTVCWGAGPNESPNKGNNVFIALPLSKIPDFGVAHLSAVVTAKGKLVRGSGVKSVTPVISLIGDYTVVFNRNVRNCTYVVSLGNTGSTGVPKTGVISATGASVNSNGVYIDVNDINGYPVERPFHLNVFCHK